MLEKPLCLPSFIKTLYHHFFYTARVQLIPSLPSPFSVTLLSKSVNKRYTLVSKEKKERKKERKPLLTEKLFYNWLSSLIKIDSFAFLYK